VGEKAFTLYEDNIYGVQQELERRGWMKLNGLIKDANSSTSVEFFSNAYQETEGDPIFETMVRGVKIRFDENTLNKMLGTPAPEICGVEKTREELEEIKSIKEEWKLELIRMSFALKRPLG